MDEARNELRSKVAEGLDRARSADLLRSSPIEPGGAGVCNDDPDDGKYRDCRVEAA